jgi:hypothetical protein
MINDKECLRNLVDMQFILMLLVTAFMAYAHWLREEKFTSQAGVREITRCW